MIPLLDLALDAHGGLTRWRQVKSIDLKLSIGGQLWHAKGLPQGLNVALHVEPSRKLVVVQGGLAVLDCQTMERFLAVHFQTGAKPIVGDLVLNQMALTPVVESGFPDSQDSPLP